ncbi:co-chaperone HscB [Denitrificimonas sp. JX-1]|uniref:Co-chaperone protein HscB homolog n=1 Tax=Denitrificimonas halotolerans TaxID=3098930 RepID=A0ABU5GTI6_9GAMM|nr:co-chaperone HscB [Denitrificimonas sp. JX-1]MDY7219942.1 co-chaperone HscB [Denitrificimonas sp. JX-1]
MSNSANAGQVDYFAMFGLQPSFLIDSKALAATYRELAKDVHPDRFASESAAQQREAVEHAARLNDAYQTLKSPTQRALYLLRQQAELPEETTIQDGEFLFQQMEWREQLETLQDQADFAAIDSFVRELKQARQAIDIAFAECVHDSEQRIQAERLARRMQFLDKMFYEVRQLEERLDD